VHLEIVQNRVNASYNFEVNKNILPAAPTGVLQKKKKIPQPIWPLSKVAAAR
jgi:hypothetical protein